MRGDYEVVSKSMHKEEEIIPLDTIRVHSKVDDIPSVTDEQLELYRSTALEQAELYTNRIIRGLYRVQENHTIDGSERGFSRKSYKAKLKWSPNHNSVFVFGGNARHPVPMRIRENTREISLKPDTMNVDLSGCCRGHGLDFKAMIQYETGYKTVEDIPSTIIYGCLKFLTWAIANPGDELLTVRNRLGTTETGLIGTNNGAWASGAIEHWMTYQVR